MFRISSLLFSALLLNILIGCGGGPDAPTGLTVTSTSPITLSWNAVSGAKNYSVYRGTATGGISTKTRLASEITVTTYTDTTAAASTTYYYQVVAVNSDGVSGPSNEVNTVSQSQSGGSFTVVGFAANSQITLNWNAISGAVTYNVYRGTTSAAITNKTLVKTGLATPTFVDTAVSSGFTYYYQVTVVNSSGLESQTSSETTGLSL
jgi:fibronectin type 3 domain-containing protein